MKARSLVFWGMFLVAYSSWAQGTVIFNNRIGNVDAPIGRGDGSGWGAFPGATAQLYLVGSSGTLTPLFPTTTFRTTSAAAQFYVNQVIVTVPGIPAGSPATVRIRAWAGGESYPSALYKIESNDVTISQLGGIPPGGGAPIPDAVLLGLLGPALVGPEPSTAALGLLGLGVFLMKPRKRKQ